MSAPQAAEPLPPSVTRLFANREQSKARYPVNRTHTWRVSRAQPRSPLSYVFASHTPDTPTSAFYRIYGFFVLNWTTAMRTELEYFCCSHPEWSVADIPDPTDPDPLRAAILAVLTQFMCDAFNRRIELGLPRDAPPIILDFEELQARPKVFEHPPEWATRTPPLPEQVVLPDENGALPDESSAEISEEFKAMNILVHMPHIHFV